MRVDGPLKQYLSCGEAIQQAMQPADTAGSGSVAGMDIICSVNTSSL